jgi:hypothetical protein
MIPIAEGCPVIAPDAKRRLEAAIALLVREAAPFDRGQAEARLAELLAMAR